ncbi:Uncharacterised protein [Bordetella pertussis]|nr:Uncharacterised protein [Bordetella pertussis]CFT98385.1 Uncharacterised protein [Bordetella pertussis]CFW07041.1 Uncharacterised protein [Bordetella pertussis]CPO93458.1 Uncharacterised protein [Bordetella pertussis]
MNCWYTMATLRWRTGTPVTSAPSTSTLPSVGRSSPAMMRITEVLPARVAPSSTVMAPGAGCKLSGYRCTCDPARS